MNRTNVKTYQRGFTLLEIMVVLAIVGIMASIIMSSSYTGTTEAVAQRVMRTTETLRTCVMRVHADLGWGANILSNPNYNSGNDALDMCIGGDVAIVTSQQNNFKDESGLADMVQIITAPANGTKGEYRVENAVMTLSTSQPSRTISVEYSPVADGVVCELLKKFEGFNSECDLSSADTTGVIQHTASSGGVTTLKILRKLAL